MAEKTWPAPRPHRLGAGSSAGGGRVSQGFSTSPCLLPRRGAGLISPGMFPEPKSREKPGLDVASLPRPAVEAGAARPEAPSPRVVIMSSILEHMCADVLQQTATQIKFPAMGMDSMPYWNLLPPKRPIKEVLTDVFAKVLERGWVDSRSIHVFDTLLHMGGVYWFCNNLIKVPGLGGGGRGHRHPQTAEKTPDRTKLRPVLSLPNAPAWSARLLREAP